MQKQGETMFLLFCLKQRNHILDLKKFQLKNFKYEQIKFNSVRNIMANISCIIFFVLELLHLINDIKQNVFFLLYSTVVFRYSAKRIRKC